MQEAESLYQKHTRIALRFVAAAESYLDEGDIIQSSEKLWGTTAHAIKAYCIARGWRHGRYAHMLRAMRRLSAETLDNIWIDGFKVAYRNHLNFYTDEKSASDVERDLQRVRLLVNRLLAAADVDDGNTSS